MKTLICFVFLVAFLEPPKALGAIGIPVGGGPVGDSSLAGPFDTSSSSRVQQVYDRGAFPSGIPPNSGFLIHTIYFRADENARPGFGNANFTDVEVRLSTTSREPDGLSTLFSENIGADETTVFGRGALSLNWSGASFVTGIQFDRPFLYNPAAGNLLLDMRNYGPTDFPELDAFDIAGDAISIAIGRADSLSGFATSTRALATLFWVDIVPIPEPSTTALLLLGLLALGWKWRRAKRSLTMRG